MEEQVSGVEPVVLRKVMHQERLSVEPLSEGRHAVSIGRKEEGVLVTFQPKDDAQRLSLFLDTILMADALLVPPVCTPDRFRAELSRLPYTEAWQSSDYPEASWRHEITWRMGGSASADAIARSFGLNAGADVPLTKDELDDAEIYRQTQQHIENQLSVRSDPKDITDLKAERELLERWRNDILPYAQRVHQLMRRERLAPYAVLVDANSGRRSNSRVYSTFFALVHTRTSALPHQLTQTYAPHPYARWPLNDQYTALGRVMRPRRNLRRALERRDTSVTLCVFAVHGLGEEAVAASMTPALPMVTRSQFVQLDADRRFYGEALRRYVHTLDHPQPGGLWHGFRGVEYVRGERSAPASLPRSPARMALVPTLISAEPKASTSTEASTSTVAGKTVQPGSFSQVGNKDADQDPTRHDTPGDLVLVGEAGLWAVIVRRERTGAKEYVLRVIDPRESPLGRRELRLDAHSAEWSSKIGQPLDERALVELWNARVEDHPTTWIRVRSTTGGPDKWAILRYAMRNERGRPRLVAGVRAPGVLYDVKRVVLSFRDFLPRGNDEPLATFVETLPAGQLNLLLGTQFVGSEPTLFRFECYRLGGRRFQGHVLVQPGSDGTGDAWCFLTCNGRLMLQSCWNAATTMPTERKTPLTVGFDDLLPLRYSLVPVPADEQPRFYQRLTQMALGFPFVGRRLPGTVWIVKDINKDGISELESQVPVPFDSVQLPAYEQAVELLNENERPLMTKTFYDLVERITRQPFLAVPVGDSDLKLLFGTKALGRAVAEGESRWSDELKAIRLQLARALHGAVVQVDDSNEPLRLDRLALDSAGVLRLQTRGTSAGREPAPLGVRTQPPGLAYYKNGSGGGGMYETLAGVAKVVYRYDSGGTYTDKDVIRDWIRKKDGDEYMQYELVVNARGLPQVLVEVARNADDIANVDVVKGQILGTHRTATGYCVQLALDSGSQTYADARSLVFLEQLPPHSYEANPISKPLVYDNTRPLLPGSMYQTLASVWTEEEYRLAYADRVQPAEARGLALPAVRLRAVGRVRGPGLAAGEFSAERPDHGGAGGRRRPARAPGPPGRHRASEGARDVARIPHLRAGRGRHGRRRLAVLHARDHRRPDGQRSRSHVRRRYHGRVPGNAFRASTRAGQGQRQHPGHLDGAAVRPAAARLRRVQKSLLSPQCARPGRQPVLPRGALLRLRHAGPPRRAAPRCCRCAAPEPGSSLHSVHGPGD